MWLGLLAALVALSGEPAAAQQQPQKPNILEAGDYVRWFIEHAFVLVPAQAIVARHIEGFRQFPPRQRPGSFSVEQAMEKLRNPPSSN
jgi:hypothetical protein